MSIILNIETATKNCSISLAKEGKTIICKEMATENFSHAEKLHIFIEEALQEANLTLKELNAIAVSQGPGSYTGLRIGVSSAKGFCYALDIPLIAIDTLELLARRIKIEEGIIIPMIDARRMEVFTAFYDKKHDKIRKTEAEIINEESYNEIQQTMHLVGDGTLKFKDTLTATKFVYHDEIIFPSANEMSLLSFEKYKKSDFVDVAYFEPYYLKDFMLAK